MFDKAAEAILTAGGVWAALFILAVAGGALVTKYLMSELLTCNKARIDDNKAMSEVIHANGVAMTAQSAANETRARAQEATARAQELAAIQAQQLTATVADLRGTNEALRNEIGRLNEGVKNEIAGLRADLQRRP
jgi:hypothetical protein